MAQQLVYLGVDPNDGTGDSPHVGGEKINANFTELYSLQSQTVNAAAYPGATHEDQIQAAIIDAALLGKTRVVIPAYMLPFDASLVTFNTAVQMTREGGDFSVYDVLAYGADPDGILLADAALAAAIAGAGAQGGQIVQLAPGSLRISSRALLNGDDIWLRGLGRSASVLLQDTAGADVLQVTGQRCKVTDLSLNWSAAASVGTYALRITDSGRGKFRDIVIGATGAYAGNAYNGVLIEATAGASSENVVRNEFVSVLVGPCVGDGWTFTGGSATRRVIDQQFILCNTSVCANGLTFNDWVQGVFCTFGVIDFCGRAINYVPTATGRSFDLFLQDIKFDAAVTNEHIYARNSMDHYYRNCWFGAPPSGRYSVIYDTGMTRSEMTNSFVGGRDAAGAPTGLIQIVGTSIRIRGNTFQQGATAPSLAGVVLTAASSFCDVADNTLEGFAIGQDISDGGTSNRIGPNYGDGYGAVARFVSGLDFRGAGVGVPAVMVSDGGIVAAGATAGQQIRFNAGSPLAAELVKWNASDYDNWRAAAVFLTKAAPAAAAGQVALGGTVAGTVGAAGGGSALPATPVGYLIINVAGTQMKVPYYNT